MKGCNCVLSILITFAEMAGCEPKESFDLQGHRGARGLLPENTIPGFIRALDEGVTTLEMDLVVTKDRQILVSHEPYMSAEICVDPEGHQIPDSLERTYNIFQMTMDEIAQFDCGSKPHPRFPQQSHQPSTKPLLKEVIDTVESYLKAKNLPDVNYNLEIKSQEEGDDIFHPEPPVYSDLVFQLVSRNLPLTRVTIQSFDFRVLRYFHQTYPQVTLALLIENGLPIQANIDSLGFMPAIYSCDYVLLSQQDVDQLHLRSIKVIPWTVNEPADMKRLVQWGVDGLITDYPNRFRELKLVP